MKESEYVNSQLKETAIENKENNLLRSAIALVKANGYDVTAKGEKPETHHIAEAKAVITESAKTVGTFMRGLGRITLEKASAVGANVSESAKTVVEKGK